jgi:glutamate synthase (ferredoxin)
MIWLALAAAVGFLVAYDISQRRHAILHNFPIIGHFRYWLEAVGPELRQYIVTSNDEERPFSRDQRRWVYSSAKQENSYFGFGSDNDMESAGPYLIVKHAAFPLDMPYPGEPAFDPQYVVPCAKTLGAARKRARAFRPDSIVNISAMSFGSLSAPAVEAINRGVRVAGCWQNTGEGGISPHHRHGGDLVWQIGTGYFGCRDLDGGFSLSRLRETVAATPAVRAIEIKLSQGAKPGLGGVLPMAKITAEIAEVRGVRRDRHCVSPAAHKEFKDVDGLLDFVELIGDATGLPVGIKSAVGEIQFWRDLARLMRTTGRGVDFVTVDGGEGGTGAAPLVFTDHVALPFKVGFARVHAEFVRQGIERDVVFIGSGKLGFPDAALFAFALGCDLVSVGREALLAIGCIQAQRCHTNHCPTGIATHNRWLMSGLDPTHKSARLANYVVSLRKEILSLSRACGVDHPSLVRPDQLEILDDQYRATTVEALFAGAAQAPDSAVRVDAR